MDQFFLSPHNWDMILRLLLATVLGGAVGIERGSGDRPPGQNPYTCLHRFGTYNAGFHVWF